MFEADNAETVGRLVRDYGERAFQFAYRLTRNIDEAKELVQESYRRVLSNWDKYDPAQPLENWFFVILRNLCLDYARSYERKHIRSMDAPVGAEEEGGAGALCDRIADGEPGIEEMLERREGAQWVQRALEELNYDQRVAVTLCDMGGMGYNEIARVLGCPEGTVRSRVSRARMALRGALAQQIKVEPT